MEFVSATCPSCGGELRLPHDHEAVKCMYCGDNIVVKQAIRTFVGVNTSNLMLLAEHAEAAGRSQEAGKLYTRVLEHEPTNARAWIGKGVCGGPYGDLWDKSCLGTAMELARDKAAAKAEIVRRLLARYPSLECRYCEVSFPDRYLAEYILSLDPQNLPALLGTLFQFSEASRDVQLARFRELKRLTIGDPRYMATVKMLAESAISYVGPHDDDVPYDWNADPRGYCEMLAMIQRE